MGRRAQRGWSKVPDKIGRRELLKLSLQASAYALIGPSSKAYPRAARPEIAARHDVIIIGAGVAGLAAARFLKSKGANVLILEARDRIGGRVRTDVSLPGLKLDLGASWIVGTRGNPIASLATNFNLRTLPTDFENVALYNSEGKRLGQNDIRRIASNYEDLLRQVERLRDQLAGAHQNDISLQEGIARVLAKQSLTDVQRSELEFAIKSEIEDDYAADTSDLSFLNWNQDEGFDGPSVLFPGGYIQIVDRLATGLEIRLSQSVRHIEHNQKGIRITTDRDTFEAERAIVTLPLGVLKREVVRFTPPLPEGKLNAIRKLGMGVLNKLYLRFPRIFWPREMDLVGVIAASKSEWTEWINYYKYNGEPVLLALNAGAYGRRLEALSDSEVIAAAMLALRKIYGKSIPDPTGALLTRWNSDPFTFGSYSFLQPGASGKDYDALAEPLGERLFFAGEATSRRYPATVQGAFLSGEREARRINNL